MKTESDRVDPGDRVHRLEQYRDLARRSVAAKVEEAQRARDLEAVVEQLKARVSEVEQQRDDLEKTAEKTVASLNAKLDRIAEQCQLWNRGELDTMTTIAGIAAEMDGYSLPEPGVWERAKAKRAAEILAEHRDMKSQLDEIEAVLEGAGFAIPSAPASQVRRALRWYEQQLERVTKEKGAGESDD